MKSAKEFWKEKFDEYPKNDAEKLAVAMMVEYALYSKCILVHYETVLEPIQNALCAAGFNTDQCETLAEGVLLYMKDYGFIVVRQ